MTLLIIAVMLITVVFSFSLGAYLVAPHWSRIPVGWSIFWTALVGTLLAILTSAAVLISIWPPLSIVSWVIWLGLAIVVAYLISDARKEGKSSGRTNEDVDDTGGDVRSGYGI